MSQYNDDYMYKQHLRNIWNSIPEKVKNTEAKLKRSVAWKKAYIPLFAFDKC